MTVIWILASLIPSYQAEHRSANTFVNQLLSLLRRALRQPWNKESVTWHINRSENVQEPEKRAMLLKEVRNLNPALMLDFSHENHSQCNNRLHSRWSFLSNGIQ